MKRRRTQEERNTGHYCTTKQRATTREIVVALTHGGGRIRTFEDRSRQIYSLLPLTAWLLHPLFLNHLSAANLPCDRRELTARIELATA